MLNLRYLIVITVLSVMTTSVFGNKIVSLDRYKEPKECTSSSFVQEYSNGCPHNLEPYIVEKIVSKSFFSTSAVCKKSCRYPTVKLNIPKACQSEKNVYFNKSDKILCAKNEHLVIEELFRKTTVSSEKKKGDLSECRYTCKTTELKDVLPKWCSEDILNSPVNIQENMFKGNCNTNKEGSFLSWKSISGLTGSDGKVKCSSTCREYSEVCGVGRNIAPNLKAIMLKQEKLVQMYCDEIPGGGKVTQPNPMDCTQLSCVPKDKDKKEICAQLSVPSMGITNTPKKCNENGIIKVVGCEIKCIQLEGSCRWESLPSKAVVPGTDRACTPKDIYIGDLVCESSSPHNTNTGKFKAECDEVGTNEGIVDKSTCRIIEELGGVK